MNDANIISESDARSEEREDDVMLSGPPEPVVRDDDTANVLIPTDDGTNVDRMQLGTWECQRCSRRTTVSLTDDGELQEPTECDGCDRAGPFEHARLTENEVRTALRADATWHPPSGVSDQGYSALWDDVREYLREHWDAGTDASADAVYAGLTAYALTTWVRDNLTFVPHLMPLGRTTGGKTRLLHTLARVSYRALVTASATPASMFRLIDAYDVSYFVSEYNGLGPDVRRELDNVVRAGQKRGEVVTRAEPTSSGYEPTVFDPFAHVAVATQEKPDDDVVNRCIRIHSSPEERDMPATFDEERGQDLRNRLLYARFRLLDSDEWRRAETSAYRYLADRDITGRTREKLLGLLTVAYLFDRVDTFESFVTDVVAQDREDTANSADALVIEAIRDLAFEEIGTTSVLGDGPDDPFAVINIPLSDVADRYEAMTGTEKSSAWVGHVRARLNLDKDRLRDGTVIRDADLGAKLRELCEEHNLDWERLDANATVTPMDDETHGPCAECANVGQLTHRRADGGHVCEPCSDELSDGASDIS